MFTRLKQLLSRVQVLWARLALARDWFMLFAFTSIAPLLLNWFVGGTRATLLVIATLGLTLAYALRVAAALSQRAVQGPWATIAGVLVFGVAVSNFWCCTGAYGESSLDLMNEREAAYNSYQDRAKAEGISEDIAFETYVQPIIDRESAATSRILFNASLVQFALVSVAWGITRASVKSFTLDVLRDDLRSRTYYVLVVVGFIYAGLSVLGKLALLELAPMMSETAARSMLSLVALLASFPFMQEDLIRLAFDRGIDAVVTTEQWIEHCAVVSVFEIVLLLNGALFLAIERYQDWIMAPASGSGTAGGRLSAGLPSNVSRILLGVLTALGTFALILTLRRVVLLVLHWPFEVRFFL